MKPHLFRGRSVLEISLAAIFVGLLIGVALFARTIRYGFSALDRPTAMESMMARNFRHWSVPAQFRNMKNPVPVTPEVLSAARAHFADHCASCHGNDGRGKTDIGQRMYPKAPDMTLPATQNLSDGELFSIIENGIRLTGMPGWGEGTADSAYGSWTLVHLVRRLPKITAAEVDEMQKLNPKSPEECEQMKNEETFLEGGNPSSSDGSKQ